MTEREFLQQVWRPYDTVTIETGIKGRVVNVCFSTRSVRIMMPQGSPEWFKCDMVSVHKSATGEPNDLCIIEDLHKKLMEAQNRIDNLQAENEKMKQRMESRNMEAIGRHLNEIAAILSMKKKRIEKLESCIGEIEDIIETMKMSHE